MNPSSDSRSRKILMLAIQNKENCSEPDISTSNLSNLPTTSTYTYSADKEYLCDEDDGDFSPASDDDRTYEPSKKKAVDQAPVHHHLRALHRHLHLYLPANLLFHLQLLLYSIYQIFFKRLKVPM